MTEKGERVRSKSEKILADYFYRNNILYQYEKPLYLKGYGTIYTDFTFLSKKTRKEIYWEHEGIVNVFLSVWFYLWLRKKVLNVFRDCKSKTIKNVNVFGR